MTSIKKILILFIIINFSFAYAKPVPESFADLAEKLMPSVVNISTTQTVRTTTMLKTIFFISYLSSLLFDFFAKLLFQCKIPPKLVVFFYFFYPRFDAFHHRSGNSSAHAA